MDEYYTCAEVAKLYKVKTATVWGWIRDGKVQAVRIGRNYRIRRSEVAAIIEDCDNKKPPNGGRKKGVSNAREPESRPQGRGSDATGCGG